jgi:hypothetical protein
MTDSLSYIYRADCIMQCVDTLICGEIERMLLIVKGSTHGTL